MGVFGTGLYSGDFAMDLRSAISAIAYLPYDGDKLVEVLCESEASAANNPNDEDHTTFWLVLADQFAKRGIVSARAREKALAIIESDADLAMFGKRGANASDLKKRQKVLKQVAEKIAASPNTNKPRAVLKKPQPLLMNVGDVFVYPTFGGRCRNPYFASQGLDRLGTMAPSWTQDSWAAMIVVDCGRAFDFLSWYRPLTISAAREAKPTLEELRQETSWVLARCGTCSPVHFKRMELERLGTWAIDITKLRHLFPDMRPGTTAAISNISIANGLHVAPYRKKPVLSILNVAGNKARTSIDDIGQILADDGP